MNKQAVINLMVQIEREMKRLSLWQNFAPSLENFVSEQPFFMDKMAPQQWLQWVLLPNLSDLIDEQQSPEYRFLISPYFEMVWQSQQLEYRQLLILLQQLDQCVAESFSCTTSLSI